MKKKNTSHITCNYDQANEIGILFDASNKENIDAVTRYVKSLNSRQKKVAFLGYREYNKKNKALVVDHITDKQLNWLLIPKDPKSKDFLTRQFDLLINLYTSECFPFEYISALSDAKYRVGRYIKDKTYCYDFMIDVEEKQDLSFLIKQVDHYLNIIK